MFGFGKNKKEITVIKATKPSTDKVVEKESFFKKLSKRKPITIIRKKDNTLIDKKEIVDNQNFVQDEIENVVQENDLDTMQNEALDILQSIEQSQSIESQEQIQNETYNQQEIKVVDKAQEKLKLKEEKERLKEEKIRQKQEKQKLKEQEKLRYKEALVEEKGKQRDNKHTIILDDDLAIVVLPNFADRAEEINDYINEKSGQVDKNHLIYANAVKFSNGDGKVKLEDSVRGKDVYIISDVSNYSITYKMYGYENHLSPDEHYLDIIRTISAIAGKAKKISVIMPLLYASRQHRRNGRESLDCSIALRELESLGVSSVVTLDAHDPNIQNATPFLGFDSIFPLYPVIERFVEDNISTLSNNQMVVISPDNGAMQRAVTYASMLKLDLGMFYKRRDYTHIINGKNPILAHEYTGPDLKDKDVIVVDDMIASGESLIDVINETKKRGAKNITAICTFAFFSEGLEKFDKLYEDGSIKAIYCTNASYVSNEMTQRKWLHIVKIEKLLAAIIYTLHNNKSLSPLINSSEKLKQLLIKNNLINNLDND